MKPDTERYVAVKIVARWLKQGYKKNDIALLWNQGNAGRCSSGTNKHGVEYDSCAYAEKVLASI